MNIVIQKKHVTPPTLDRLAYSAKETAILLGITERTLRNWDREGRISSRLIGGRRLYSVKMLRTMLGETEQ